MVCPEKIVAHFTLETRIFSILGAGDLVDLFVSEVA